MRVVPKPIAAAPRLIAPLVVALLAASCGAGGENVTVASGQTPAELPTATVGADEELLGQEGETPAAPTPSGAEPRPAESETLLDPVTALLPAELLGGGSVEPSVWDGYEIGVNQSDCVSFWELQRVVQHRSASRFWMVPDGNLNHVVYDTGDADIAAAYAELAARTAAECPVVTWLEGGTTSLEIQNWEGSTGEALVGLREVTDTGDETWAVFMAHENLLSHLWLVRWNVPADDAEMRARYGDWVHESHAALLGADVQPDPTPSPIPTPLPSPTPEPTPTPEAAEVDASLVLLEQALPRSLESLDGPRLETVEPHKPNTTNADAQAISDCPASVAITALDIALEVFADVPAPPGAVERAAAGVGRTSGPEAAREMVVALLDVTECEPGVDTDTQGWSTFEGALLRDDEDTTAAYIANRNESSARFLIAYRHGDLVGLTVLGTAEGGLRDRDFVEPIAEVAVGWLQRGADLVATCRDLLDGGDVGSECAGILAWIDIELLRAELDD